MQPANGSFVLPEEFAWETGDMNTEVRKLLVDQLKDAFSAEKQALRCMQKSARKASSAALKQGIELHIQQTVVQIERVTKALGLLDEKPGRKLCMAMKGLVEEATEESGEHEKGPILDLVIVASMQRIEHYEIAAYGTDVAFAEALGEMEVANLLRENLVEEKATDLSLTRLTKQSLMAAAMAQGGDEPKRGSRARAT